MVTDPRHSDGVRVRWMLLLWCLYLVVVVGAVLVLMLCPAKAATCEPGAEPPRLLTPRCEDDGLCIGNPGVLDRTTHYLIEVANDCQGPASCAWVEHAAAEIDRSGPGTWVPLGCLPFAPGSPWSAWGVPFDVQVWGEARDAQGDVVARSSGPSPLLIWEPCAVWDVEVDTGVTCGSENCRRCVAWAECEVHAVGAWCCVEAVVLEGCVPDTCAPPIGGRALWPAEGCRKEGP